MLLTTSIKLVANQDQKRQLLKTMYKFNSACDWVSQYAFANKCFGKLRLHKAIYYELREKFDLPSQFAIRVIGRVADSYKLNKKVQHKFNKSSSAEYDQRLLSWTALDNVSIASLDGRLHLPIAFGKYAKLDERTIRKSCKLAYKNKEFYLQVSYEEPEVLLKEAKAFLGVDLGITNLAVTSNGQVFSGSQVDKVRERFTTIKTSLQACGSKSAKRGLKEIIRKGI